MRATPASAGGAARACANMGRLSHAYGRLPHTMHLSESSKNCAPSVCRGGVSAILSPWLHRSIYPSRSPTMTTTVVIVVSGGSPLAPVDIQGGRQNGIVESSIREDLIHEICHLRQGGLDVC